ncbi:hypothetical protein ACKGJN_14665 [Gillisia sp. Q332]|uniref:hypothetical protein n=1 Tax=Gillisia xinjiangensis TaxID=3384765 RepID=UPI00391C3D10
MKFKSAIVIAAFFLIFTSCGEKTEIVESGTYQGTIDEVEPAKTEIYVRIQDDKILELYFNENTSLTRNGETIDFSVLEEGQNVEVEVEKTGKRLDPISVKILE